MWNKRFCAITFGALVLVIAAVSCESGEKGSAPASSTSSTSLQPPAPVLASGIALTYNFDNVPAGALPATFSSARTGGGAVEKWEIRADETAPSKPNVLAQTSDDSTDYRFPIAVSNEGAFKDLELSVKFKAVSGNVDQAGGLVFRYLDENNYYIVRANALENNYTLYHVIKGSRRQFASANLTVTPKQWHELKVVCFGNQVTCFFDGQQAIQATDETFKEAGKVGVWTKADSVTYFDDLSVTVK